MAFIDELRAALMHWTAGGPAILPPLPPDPGMPSGGPAPAGGGVVPLAADGTPLLDSGIHMYQPRDVGLFKWSARYRRLVGLQAGTGLQDYPATLVPSLATNTIGTEDIYPEEGLGYAFLAAAPAGATIAIVQLTNPAGSGRLVVVEQLVISLNIAAGVDLLYSNDTALTTGRNVFAADTRGISKGLGVGSLPGTLVARASSDTTLAAVPAAASSAVGIVNFTAATLPSVVVPVKFVLVPGISLMLATDTAGAQKLFVMPQWREVVIP